MISNEECPICFIMIKNVDPYFMMKCCKKIVHIQCLTDWYSSKTTAPTCFMCNQTSDIYDDLVISENNTDNLENSNTNSNTNSNINSNTNSNTNLNNELAQSISISMLNHENNTNRKKIISTLICFSVSITTCIIFIFIFIYQPF